MKTRNRILSIFLAVLMVVSAIPFAFANDGVEIGGQCGENAHWKLDDQGKLTIFGGGEMKFYELRYDEESGSYYYEYYDSWSQYSSQIQSVEIKDGITSIANNAFRNCCALTAVDIPESVSFIDDYAFLNCSALEEVNIPDGVMDIGDSAFASCSALQSVTLPDSLITIGEGAFKFCQTLAEITISESVEEIGDSAFSSCSALQSVTLPDSLIAIGERAFEFCQALAEITIPEGVEEIGCDAFFHCSELTKMTIPNSVSEIGEGAFSSCYSLTEFAVAGGNSHYSSDDGVLFNKAKTLLLQYPLANLRTAYTIPDSVTEIAALAFHDADNLRSITIAESITKIGDEAFLSCDGIETFSIPAGVTTIGNRAFGSCTHLKSFVVDEANPRYTRGSGNALYDKEQKVLLQYPCANEETDFVLPVFVTSIAEYAFHDACYLRHVTLTSGLKTIKDCAFSYCRALESVDLSDTVTDIGTRAFANCGFLKAISIPRSVSYLGEHVFETCRALEAITVDVDNEFFFSDENGILCSRSGSVLQYPLGSLNTSVALSAGIKNIGVSAFARADKLQTVVLPDSLQTIEHLAFHSCSSLQEIRLPDGVFDVDQQAFEDCSSLKAIYWPYSLSNINGGQVFFGCDSLQDVYYAGSETEWEQVHIYGNENLKAATVHFCDHETTLNIPALTPTCAVPGHTAGVRCADCGRLLEGCEGWAIAHVDETNDGLCDVCGQPVSELELDTKKAVDCKEEPLKFRFIPLKDGEYFFTSSAGEYSVRLVVSDEKGQELQVHTIRDGVGDIYNGLLTKLNAGHVYFYSVQLMGTDIPENYSMPINVILERMLRGNCGNNIWWQAWRHTDNNSIYSLNFYGDGEMWDYSGKKVPWSEIAHIDSVYFDSGISSINPALFAELHEVREIRNNSYTLVTASIFKDIAEEFVVMCYNNSAEHLYCKENGIPYQLYDAETKNLQDEDTGVEIAFYPDTFDDEDVTLAVKTIDTQNENARAWSIAPVNDQGEKVQPNQRVQIRLPLPEGWNRMPLLITHTHDDGEIEIISGNNYWFEGDYVVFWVSRFSKFEVTALENIPEPHTHTYISSVTIQPTCTSAGLRTYTCTSCEAGTIGHTYSEPIGAVGHVYGSWTIIKEPSCKEAGMEMHVCVNCLDQRESHSLDALGHIDRDGDGYCDREGCGEMMTGGDLCPQCGKVHKGFFQKIVGFFHKIIYRLTHLFEK